LDEENVRRGSMGSRTFISSRKETQEHGRDGKKCGRGDPMYRGGKR